MTKPLAHRKLALLAIGATLCVLCALSVGLLWEVDRSSHGAFSSLEADVPQDLTGLQEKLHELLRQAYESPSDQRDLGPEESQTTLPVDKLERVDPEVDPEWGTFPKWGHGLGYMYTSLKLLDASNLYRHKLLNSTDQYIEPSRRYELAGIVATIAPVIDDFARLRTETATSELRALIERGLANTTTVQEHHESLSPKEQEAIKGLLTNQEREYLALGLSPAEASEKIRATHIVFPSKMFGGRMQVVTLNDGKEYYGAEIGMLPHTRSVVRFENAFVTEMVVRIVGWFTANDLMSYRSAEEEIRRFIAYMDDRWDRSP